MTDLSVYNKAQLLFPEGEKGIFDRLIYRILMLVMEQNQKSAIKFYDNGPYCYKFADILKDNNKLYWIKIAPWETVRTFWIKVVELTEYLGQYKAYDGILRYMFGDDINPRFTSMVTEMMERELNGDKKYYEWKCSNPYCVPQTLWTQTKEEGANNIGVYKYDTNIGVMKLFSNSYKIKNGQLKEIEKDGTIVTNEFDEIETTGYNDVLGYNDTELMFYSLTGQAIKYNNVNTFPKQAGNLWITMNETDSMIRKYFWLTDEQKNTLIAYKNRKPLTDYPLYVSSLRNINLDIINQVIDFLTPVGYRTYFIFSNTNNA